jgi:hypothetical protein
MQEKSLKKVGMTTPTPDDDNNKIIYDDGKIIPDYIDNLESIINFSKEKKKVLINFSNDFWKYILNCYNDITTKYI